MAPGVQVKISDAGILTGFDLNILRPAVDAGHHGPVLLKDIDGIRVEGPKTLEGQGEVIGDRDTARSQVPAGFLPRVEDNVPLPHVFPFEGPGLTWASPGLDHQRQIDFTRAGSRLNDLFCVFMAGDILGSFINGETVDVGEGVDRIVPGASSSPPRGIPSGLEGYQGLVDIVSALPPRIKV